MFLVLYNVIVKQLIPLFLIRFNFIILLNVQMHTIIRNVLPEVLKGVHITKLIRLGEWVGGETQSRRVLKSVLGNFDESDEITHTKLVIQIFASNQISRLWVESSGRTPLWS